MGHRHLNRSASFDALMERNRAAGQHSKLWPLPRRPEMTDEPSEAAESNGELPQVACGGSYL